MAGEVGHVVYGARLLEHLKETIQSSSYWAGTLFPDIRHLGVISRHRTHLEKVTLETLAGKNDFQTGMRVHTWIDAMRESFLREKNIKESLPWHPFVPHALKLAEDEILYNRYHDWNLIQRVLNTVYDDELEYVNDKKHVQRWHTILQNYLHQKPDNASRKEISCAIGLSEASAEEINSVVTMLLNNNKTQEFLEEFIHRLESVLQ